MIVSLANDLPCSKTSAFYLPLGSRFRIYTLPCRVAQSYTTTPLARARSAVLNCRIGTPLSCFACHRSCSSETQGSTNHKFRRLVRMLVFQCIMIHAEDISRITLAANDLIPPINPFLPRHLSTPMYVLIYILSQYTVLSHHHLTGTRETNLSIMIH